jgi:S1-C subfamily serine protease
VVTVSNLHRAARWRTLITLLVGLALVLLALLAFDQLIAVSPIERKKTSVEASVDNVIGATVEPLDKGAARAIGVAPDAEGLIVTSVASRGAAARAGLLPGDVIEAIGNKKVRSPTEAAEAVDDQRVLVTVTVNRKGHYAKVRLPISPAAEG